jgi:hypothetical protein
MTVTYSMATQDNRPVGDDPRRAGRGPLRMTPGRVTALLFGVPVCVALVGATALSLVADLGSASYPVNYTFPGPAARVVVSTGGGQLTLGQAAVDRVKVTGTAHYSLIRPNPVATLTDHVATYDYHCRAPVGSCGLDATVTVPTGTPASVFTGGGNLEVTGTTGTVSLNTDGGDLAAQNVSGAVSLSSGGGNIAVGTVSGALTMNTAGGNIQATTVRSASVTAGSGGGNITITFTAVPDDVNVSTAGGNITIVLPPGPTVYRVNTTTAGGNISDNSIPHDKTSPNVINATSGGGNITISEA